MKSLQARNLKTTALIKAKYTAVHSSDEQAFDLSEESEGNKTLSLRNRCGPFQVKVRLSRPKNMAASDPSKVTKETP